MKIKTNNAHKKITNGYCIFFVTTENKTHTILLKLNFKVWLFFTARGIDVLTGSSLRGLTLLVPRDLKPSDLPPAVVPSLPPPPPPPPPFRSWRTLTLLVVAWLPDRRCCSKGGNYPTHNLFEQSFLKIHFHFTMLPEVQFANMEDRIYDVTREIACISKTRISS